MGKCQFWISTLWTIFIPVLGCRSLFDSSSDTVQCQILHAWIDCLELRIEGVLVSIIVLVGRGYSFSRGATQGENGPMVCLRRYRYFSPAGRLLSPRIPTREDSALVVAACRLGGGPGDGAAWRFRGAPGDGSAERARGGVVAPLCEAAARAAQQCAVPCHRRALRRGGCGLPLRGRVNSIR